MTQASIRRFVSEAALEASQSGQDAAIVNHGTRVAALETLGGLAPGSVSDATVTDLLANPASTTAAQLAGFIATESPIVAAAKPSGGDDTAALNAKLAANAGKVLQLKAGQTYKINNTLNIPSGTTLDGAGATLDARTIPVGTVIGQRIALLAQGSLGTAVPVGIAVTKWSRVIAGMASTAGIEVGDLIFLTSDERPVPGMVRGDRDKGELLIVASKDSATQITVTTGVLFDYYGTATLQVQKVTPAENVTIKGLNILLGGKDSAHNGIEVRYGRNITVRDVTIDGAEDIALNLRTVINGKALNNTIRNSTSPSFSSTGYGVSIVDGSRDCLVEGNNFYNCRHFVAGGGLWPAVYVDVKDNHGIKSLSAAYDCHEPTFYWAFTGNTGTGVFNGFGIRGQYITVEDNLITDCAGRAYDAGTVDLVTEQRGIRFINNRGIRAGAFGISADGKAAGAEPDCVKIDIEIRGNVLRDCGPDAIFVRNFDGVTIIGNNVNTPSRHGILALGNASGTPSKRLTLDSNTITSPAGDGVQAQFVDDINGTGGVVTSPALYGYEFITCNRTRLTGVTVRTPVRSGIYLNGGAVHTVTGGTVTGGTDAGYDALRGSGASDITVNGGYYAGPRTAVATTGGDRVIITGVNATGTVSATKISTDATSKVLANNLP